MQKVYPFTERKYVTVLIFVTSLFMLWGIAITMGDVLNRHFQNVLHVSKRESGLVQFSIFGAYAVMAIPAGLFMRRFGYKKGVLFGLFLYALGAFLFVPSASAPKEDAFLLFRGSLFILACGLATLETVAHPFVAALGVQQTSDQRINFAQSFNGLGAVIGPSLGSYFILREGQGYADELTSVKLLYVGIGLVILSVAVAFSFVKVPPLVDPHAAETPDEADTSTGKPLIKQRHFVWAAIAQLFNVAAQGGTWAFFIIYGAEKIQGLSDEMAGYYFSLSMFMMLAGRFLGTLLMRFIKPNRLLAGAAICNIIICIVVAQSWGWTSFVALIMINFFFSIMFPTIFSLGLKSLGSKTQQASSFIVMGVVGGALFPPIMGAMADAYDVATAYYLPIICYIVIFLFGARFYKVRD